MKKAGIYKITCVENGHFYIGRTIDYNKRIAQHKIDLKSGKHKNQRMQHCYDKYGADSFLYELIMQADETIDLVEEEQKLIDQYIDLEECMNINRSAKTFCDVPMTEERKEKISKARKGKKGQKRMEEQRKHISDALMGHKLSEETKKKISEAHKGKKLSAEHLQKLSDLFSGEGNPMYGRIGNRHPFSIPIWQIDPCNGDKIRKFESAVDAAKALGANKNGSTIRTCIKKGYSAYGFYWLEDKKGQSTSESTVKTVNE